VVGATSAVPASEGIFTLPDLAETNLQATLDAITDTHGPISAFVHLNPKGNGALFDVMEKALVKHVFLIAKHLKKPLENASGFTAFVTATRLDGMLGAGDGPNTGVIAGGLFGLAKTLNLEWPSVFCRGVDLAATLTDVAAADALIAELHDPNRLIVETGIGPQGRHTLLAKTTH